MAPLRQTLIGALLALAGPLASSGVAAATPRMTPACPVLSLAVVASALAESPASASGSDSAAAASDLSAPTAPAWVPDQPVKAERTWEQVVRFPFRVATFPLALVGRGTEGTLRFVEETSLVPRVTFFVAALPRAGVLVLPASLGDRTGFGLMARVTPPFLGRMVRLEASGSTHKYTRTGVHLSRGPAALEYQYDWRPRERFFGAGLATSDEHPSTFAYREQHVRAEAVWPWRAPTGQSRQQVAVWAGPREMILHRGREAPSFESEYPATAFQLDRRQEHFVYGARVGADRRSGVPHWTRGWRVALQGERFDRAIEALTLRDAHTTASQFTRVTLDAEAGFSFYRDPRTLRLAVRGIHHRRSSAVPLLLPDLATLGGHEGLAGFEPGRFHDEDAVVAKLTYILPLFRNLELDLHAETGGVFPAVEDMRASRFRNSYGVGLRPRTDLAPLGYVGVDWSNESVRLRFSLGGVE